MKKSTRHITKPLSLWWYFVGVNLAVYFATAFMLGTFYMLIIHFQLIPEQYLHFGPLFMLITNSTILATFITTYLGKRIFKPLDGISHATRQVAKGDFTVKLPENHKVKIIHNFSTDFNTMVGELASIETLRSDFINNVSHEFKSPLAAIEGYAMLLQSSDLADDEKQSYLDMIIQSTHQLSNMTSNILTLSKLEQGSAVPSKQTFSLDEQIRQAILLLEGEWGPKNMALEIDLEDVMFTGPEPLLFQVWLNLIGNAVKFSHDGGSLTVRLSTRKQMAYISVKDTGIGMTEDVIQHIFDKFYQGDTSHSGEGNGLGMALVYNILHTCDGTIDIYSVPGEGTTISVRLPI